MSAETTKNKFIKDMTTGSEIKHILAFTLPMLLGNLFQQFYNMADTIIVGRTLGSVALGGVGAVGSITFLFYSLCIGLSNGIGILIAQNFGAGRANDVKKIIGNAIYVTLAVGVIISLISAFGAWPILKLMKTTDANFPYAITYMRIVCGGAFIIACYNTISAILRALGDSKTPLIFLIVSCIVNIGLDFLFILVFHMGVAGAALATILAQLAATIGSIIFGISKNPYLRLEKEHLTYDAPLVGKIFKVGVPLAAQGALIALSCVTLQVVVNKFNNPAINAAYTASNRVEMLVQQPFGSLGAAVTTFVGQNVGANRYDRVKKGVIQSVIACALFALLMVFVMRLFGDNIVGMFIDKSDDVSVIEIGTKGLQFTSLCYFPLGLIYIFRGMLNGVGDVTFAMMNGIAEVTGRVGFALLFAAIPSIGFMGIWYTNGLTWGLTAAVNLFRVIQGKWKTKSILDK